MDGMIRINSEETTNDSHLIGIKLNEAPANLMLLDNSTIKAVSNCNNELDSSNSYRKAMMLSLNDLGIGIQMLGDVFQNVDENISKQWGVETDEL